MILLQTLGETLLIKLFAKRLVKKRKIKKKFCMQKRLLALL